MATKESTFNIGNQYTQACICDRYGYTDVYLRELPAFTACMPVFSIMFYFIRLFLTRIKAHYINFMTF